jgi:hypothetical protein
MKKTQKKKIAIIQSNYLPWIGFFHLLKYSDEFIVLDDVQYTKRDWRNRNLIKSQNGTSWLTVPVQNKGKFKQTISETIVENSAWQHKHWNSIKHAYSKAPFYKEVASWLEPIYTSEEHKFLSEVNLKLLKAINLYLDIKTPLVNSTDFTTPNEKNERLVSLVKQLKGNIYVSGPSAKNYIDEHLFTKNGITIEWFKYPNYPCYKQLWGDFSFPISIIDTLFNCGTSTKSFLIKE